MPMVVPFVVTAITAVTSAVIAAGPIAVAAFNVANIALVAGATVAAADALTPKVPSSGAAIEWAANPDAPMHFAAGRVGVAGQIVHNAVYGPDQMFVGFVNIVSAAGPIKSWVSFKADDTYVSFDGAGKANSSYYANVMWRTTRNGRQDGTDTALASPAGLKDNSSMPNWGSSYKLPGKACYMLTLAENSKRSAYKGKVPTGVNTIEGLFGWDPRQDSTYPGGSGPCRLNDTSTWVYLTNPILWALKWTLGLWEGPTGKGAPQVDYQVGGIGAKLSGIDVVSFVEAANVADSNGWKVAAWPSTDDSKAKVLDSFLQAGGAIYAEKAGRIACVHRAAPRASIVTITGADTAGPIEIDTAASRINRINTIRPRYWSEAHDWQMTAADPVTADAWKTEDGGTRPRGVDYPYVPFAKQARELAALDAANTREGIQGVIPLRPYMQGLEPGDCVTITEPDFVLNGLKCLILEIQDESESDVIRATFVSETDGKYPFAFGQTTVPPEAPSLTPSDPTLVSPPLPGDWTGQPRPPGPGGTQLPMFDFWGAVSNSTATAVVVEISYTNEWPGEVVYSGPPTTEKFSIMARPGEQFWLAVIYQRDLNYSERLIFGPYTAPAFIAEIAPDAPALEDIRAEARAKAALLIKEAAGRWNRDETDKRFAIRNIEIVSEKLATAVQTLELADQDQIALVETERTARIEADEAETLARTLQISGVEEALSIVDERSSTTATALSAETETRTSQVSSLGEAIAIADERATTAATAATAAAERTTALVAEVEGVASTVTINAEAIADLEAQNNIARFDLEAAAGGGKPARFSLVSGPEKTAIALMADRIWHGDNSFWDDASDTMQTLTGDGRRLVTNGPFGALGEMLMWLGPESIAVSDMARGNADFFLARNAPRVGGNDLSIGGGFQGWVTGAAFRASPTTGAVTTTAVTAETSGATGSVSAEWIQVTFNHTGWTIIAPNSPTTGFRNTVGTAEIKSDKFGVIQRDSGTGRTLGMIVVPATVLHNI